MTRIEIELDDGVASVSTLRGPDRLLLVVSSPGQTVAVASTRDQLRTMALQILSMTADEAGR